MGNSIGREHFVAFLPMSNWISGYDRYSGVLSKRLFPNARYPTHFYMFKKGSDYSIGIEKARAMAKRLGENGGKVAWVESVLDVGLGRMEPNAITGTGVGWAWPSPEIPVSKCGIVAADGAMEELLHEQLTANAYAACRGESLSWASCAPRTISVLPIAMACQASCAFCFSKASASEAARQRALDPSLAKDWARAAKRAGASRAVITGGGEPTLAKRAALAELIAILSKEVGPTLIITNGLVWGALSDGALTERLDELSEAGLSTIALSRHGVDRESSARIMGMDANAERLSSAISKHGKMKNRAICVLQKGGIESLDDIQSYLAARAQEGVGEVCFKELYVSSLSENPWAMSRENQFAIKNQVPLSVAVGGLLNLGFVESMRLPWGSPVFEGRIEGVKMSVAAYTEPSVGWEMANRIARSWNLMADGKCLASLEDPESLLTLPEDDK